MRTPRSLLLTVAFLLLVMCSGVAYGQADELMKSQAETGWQFVIMPYLWMASMNGEAQVGWYEHLGDVVPIKVPIDIGFGDIWGALDFTLGVYFEAGYDEWGGLVDVFYVQTTEVQRDVVHPELGPGTMDAKVGLTVVDVLGGYRLQQTDVGSISLLFGARYNDWRPELEVAFEDTTLSSDAGGSWTDPMIGVRFDTDFAHWWYASVRVEIGGFGAGSDFAWGLHGILGFWLADFVDLNIAYRAIGVDWHSEGAGIDARTLDLTQSGLVFGVGFRF